MKGNIILAVIALCIITVFIRVNHQKINATPDDQSQIIIFYGDTCPHCKNVEQYITDNKLDTKLKISFKEVYRDTANQQLLQSTIGNCPEIDSSQGIGVPLAYDKTDKFCYLGDTAIIDWLKSQLP